MNPKLQTPGVVSRTVKSCLGMALFLSMHQFAFSEDALPDIGLGHDEELTEAFLANGVEQAGSLYRPRDYYIDDLAEALDYDPDKAFVFLRDEVGFDLYKGMLRGAGGTLAAGSGNAVDRALLLAELLEVMGYEVRFAYADLETETARKLLVNQRAMSPRHEVNPVFPSGAIARIEARWRRNDAWLREGLADTPLDSAANASLSEDLKQHVWVQARLSGNRWTDLDPSLADAQPGEALVEPRQFSLSTDTLDAHRVSLSVVAEESGSGGFNETPLLETEGRAVELQQTPIFVAFAKTNPTMGGVLASKLQGEFMMKPLLILGSDTLSGKSIPGSGLFAHSAEDSAVSEFFSDNSAGATALYLDITLHAPTGERLTRRRVLFDRVPPRLRAKGGPVDAKSLVPLPLLNDVPMVFHDVHQIMISTGGLNRHLAMVDLDQALGMSAASFGSDEPPSAGSLADALLPFAATNFAWLAGVEQVQSSMRQKENVRWFMERPHVYLRSVLQRPTPDGLMIGQVIDLLHDDVGVFSPSTDGPSRALQRVSYGALMAAVEAVTGEMTSAMTPGGGGETLSASMLTRFSPYRMQRQSLSEPGWYSAALADDLRNDLLVVTAGDLEEHRSWWSIDPRTGATRSRGFGGVGYTLLPRWFRLRLTSLSNNVYRINAAELNRWALETSRKTRLATPKQPTNYKGIFKSRAGRSAADEYLTTVDIGLTLATTVGEGLALAIGFQLLLITGMVTYGVVAGVY